MRFPDFFRRKKEVDIWDQFRLEKIYELEGGRACVDGASIDECPYDEKSYELQWQSWRSGFYDAENEINTMAAGEVFFCDSGPLKEEEVALGWMRPGTGTPLRDAYRRGWWKPKYVTVPVDWKCEAA